MDELQRSLKHQERLHKKVGSHGLARLFESASEEIERLRAQLENPKGLQEFVCLEQLKEIPIIEIHRAHQKLHEENKNLNDRVKQLCSLLREFSIEYECDIRHKYSGMIDVPNERPTTRKAFDRDMEIINRVNDQLRKEQASGI